MSKRRFCTSDLEKTFSASLMVSPRAASVMRSRSGEASPDLRPRLVGNRRVVRQILDHRVKSSGLGNS